MRRHDEGEISELRKRFDSLTGRERELFAFVISGKPNKQIADAVRASEVTVKNPSQQLAAQMRRNLLRTLFGLPGA
jgi:FixJ family two-component response regulator